MPRVHDAVQILVVLENAQEILLVAQRLQPVTVREIFHQQIYTLANANIIQLRQTILYAL